MMKQFSLDNLKQTFALMINAIKGESTSITVDYDADDKCLIVDIKNGATSDYSEGTKH